MITVLFRNGAYAIRTPYSDKFVTALKANVPASDRKWSASDKTWVVSPAYAKAIRITIAQTFGEDVEIPEAQAGNDKQRRQFEMRYLGTIKDRDDLSRSAYGFAGGDWCLVFPEDALKVWFKNDPAKKQAQQSLYELLAIDAKAKADEVKGAYRRLAKLTHPDVNKEPDASERFRAIQNAYEILSDSTKRAKYDAGLRLMQTTNGQYGLTRRRYSDFQPPIRCGVVDVTGLWRVGRFEVETIHSWQDITDMYGRILVTSWPMNAKTYVEHWVDPKYV